MGCLGESWRKEKTQLHFNFKSSTNIFQCLEQQSLGAWQAVTANEVRLQMQKLNRIVEAQRPAFP